MKKGNRVLIYFTAFIILLFLSGYYLYLNNTLSAPDWTAFLAGGFLTTLNFYTGIISLRIALKKPDNRFLSIVYGGMILRLALMLAAVYAGLQFLEFRRDVFIFVIFVFYTISLIIEIFYFYLLKEKDS
jgi:hypothetical protein